MKCCICNKRFKKKDTHFTLKWVYDDVTVPIPLCSESCKRFFLVGPEEEDLEEIPRPQSAWEQEDFEQDLLHDCPEKWVSEE